MAFYTVGRGVPPSRKEIGSAGDFLVRSVIPLGSGVLPISAMKKLRETEARSPTSKRSGASAIRCH